MAVYVIMRFVLPVVIPFLFGGLLAMLLNPVVEFVAGKTGRGRGTISMIVVVLVLAVAGVAFFYAGRVICMQLAALAQNADVIESNMRMMWGGCCERIASGFGIRISGADRLFTAMQQKVKSGFQTSTLPYLLKNSVSYARAMFSVMGIGLVSVISGMMMLADYPKISGAMRKSKLGRLAVQIKQHAKEAGGTYVRAQIVILLIISLICAAGLFFAGNAYALLAGMGIGLCDALPFVGTGVVFVPWMIIDVINGNYVLAAVYAVLYVLCSFARQLLEPRLIGGKLGYPPIVVLISLYVGVHVYGASGVLAGPVSAFLIYELYFAGLKYFGWETFHP